MKDPANRLEVPIGFQYTNSMNTKNNQTLNEAGLTYIAFKSEDEQIFISELVCELRDMGVNNIIITKDGFFCLSKDADELIQMFKDNAAELVD